MNLQTALSNVNSFKELAPIIENAWEGITLFGFSYVSAVGYSGEAHIDALAVRVIDMVKNDPNFSKDERVRGKDIASRINRIYNISDERFKKTNIITQIFWWARDSFYLYMSGGKGPRFYWLESERNQIFDSYTDQQHESVFNVKPNSENQEKRRFWPGGDRRWLHQE